MSETRVVHVNDKIEGAVYIGRHMPKYAGSKLANPFRIGPDGQRRHVIEKFRNHLEAALVCPMRAKYIDALILCRDKPLACWCRHDGEPKTAENACHGDILVELLDRYTDDELRAMAT